MKSATDSDVERKKKQSASDEMGGEINLADLWLVLVRRKIVIFVVLAATVIGAVAFIALTKPVYESRAVLEIGKIAGSGSILLEDPTVVVRWLREEYRLDDRDRSSEYPRLDSVEHQTKSGQNIIVLRARDFSTDGAQSFVAGVARRAMERHRILFEEARNVQELRLRDLEEDIGELQAQAKLLENLTKRLHDGAQAAVVAVERGNLLGTLARLRSERMTLVLSLSAVQSYPSRLIAEPISVEKPIKPRPALYLAMGIVFGVFFGVLGAFGAEFLSKVKNNQAARRQQEG